MAKKFFSDAEFTEIVKDKPGNIRLFRKKLRERGLLEPREQLSDDKIALYVEIKKYKDESNCTWISAMDEIIADSTGDKNASLEMQNNILLKEILYKMDKLLVSLTDADSDTNEKAELALPSESEIQKTILVLLSKSPNTVLTMKQLYEKVKEELNLPDSLCSETSQITGDNVFQKKVRFANQGLKTETFVETIERGVFKLTESGKLCAKLRMNPSEFKRAALASYIQSCLTN